MIPLSNENKANLIARQYHPDFFLSIYQAVLQALDAEDKAKPKYTITEDDVIAAAQYGLNYATESQHNGEVPKGNVLQWLYVRQKREGYVFDAPAIGDMMRKYCSAHGHYSFDECPYCNDPNLS